MAPKKKATAFNADYLADIGTTDNDIFGKMEQEVKTLQEELQQADPTKIVSVPLSQLLDNPYQGREVMDEEELQILADEIRETGFLGVLVARKSSKNEGSYEILSGHRRKLAAGRAGLTELPVIVKEYTDEQMLFLGAKENILRVDFTPLEEGKIFQRMMEEMGSTQVEVATKIHKSRGYVRARLALVNTYLDIQEMVTQYPETVRAAYYLAQIGDEALRKEAERALVSRQISGDAVPAYVQKLQEAKEQPEQPQRFVQQEKPATLPSSTPVPFPDSLEGSDQETLQTVEIQPAPLSQPSFATEPVSASAKEESRLERELSYLQGYAHRLKQRPRSPEERQLLEKIAKVIQQINEADPFSDSTTAS
jgi:ParB family transcriptional regulator, chromosome partitioning protein